MLRAYMFNYNIKNIGVIKDVSPDVVYIIDKLYLNNKGEWEHKNFK